METLVEQRPSHAAKRLAFAFLLSSTTLLAVGTFAVMIISTFFGCHWKFINVGTSGGQARKRIVQLSITRRSLCFGREDGTLSQPPPWPPTPFEHWTSHPAAPSRALFDPAAREETFFGFRTSSYHVPAGKWQPNDWSGKGVVIPLWSVLVVTSAYPLTWVLRRRSRRLHRAPGARCVQCGYDLRASPTQCPECGTERLRRPGRG